MRVALRVPQVSVAITEGTIVGWLAEEGHPVVAGAPVYTLETEKVETEVPAPVSGVLHRVGQAGATYGVGAEVGWIDEG